MAYNEEQPFVASPLPEYDIPFESYTVNANEFIKLVYQKSSSEIDLPKNAFVDANSNDVMGDLQIEYREFENPKTFVLAGIPMTYDEDGETFHFESAGMMEIRAFKDGKPIFKRG